MNSHYSGELDKMLEDAVNQENKIGLRVTSSRDYHIRTRFENVCYFALRVYASHVTYRYHSSGLLKSHI